MTPAGVIAIRKAAALTHLVPGVRLRITHDGAYLAEVGHDVIVRTEGTPMRLTPCQLRVALSRVTGEVGSGRRISAFGLPVGVDPALHLGVSGTGTMAVHPFGTISWTTDEATGCSFATTLPLATAHAVLDEVLPHPREDVGVRVRDDADLGTCVIDLSSPAYSRELIVAIAHEVLAACGAEEVTMPPWCPSTAARSARPAR